MNFVIENNSLVFKNDKQSSYKCDELFLNIKEKDSLPLNNYDYDNIFSIDLSAIEIEGNLWKELYRFKNLRSINIGYYDDHFKFTIYEFEYLYNNNVKIEDNFAKYLLRFVFEFYKRHQDDVFYKNELFETYLNDVEFCNITDLHNICIGCSKYDENVNLGEVIRITFDSFNKKDENTLIFKNKFGEFYEIAIY